MENAGRVKGQISTFSASMDYKWDRTAIQLINNNHQDIIEVNYFFHFTLRICVSFLLEYFDTEVSDFCICALIQ